MLTAAQESSRWQSDSRWQSVTVDCGGFSVGDTLTSGQCFRWVERNGRYCGTAFGQYIEVAQEGTSLTVYGSDEEGFTQVWRDYFDLGRDYEDIRRRVTACEPRLEEAAAYAGGIHILRQEPWEALCSFVISQNNNIPRIRRIIRTVCERYGQRAADWEYAAEEADAMTFPTAEALTEVSEDEWRACGCGYRAAYLTELSHRAARGGLDVAFLREAPIAEARRYLLSFKGVGAKVAECALLYGFGRLECFPVDVWIRRALETEFTGATALRDSEYAGVAQQYIFEYFRKK